MMESSNNATFCEANPTWESSQNKPGDFPEYTRHVTAHDSGLDEADDGSITCIKTPRGFLSLSLSLMEEIHNLRGRKTKRVKKIVYTLRATSK